MPNDEDTAMDTPDSNLSALSRKRPEAGHFRFHFPHAHLDSTFGDDWFALKAEAFARFFGTPAFLVGQTLVVTLWITANVLVATKTWHFDEYPFILLNLPSACRLPTRRR